MLGPHGCGGSSCAESRRLSAHRRGAPSPVVTRRDGPSDLTCIGGLYLLPPSAGDPPEVRFPAGNQGQPGWVTFDAHTTRLLVGRVFSCRGWPSVCSPKPLPAEMRLCNLPPGGCRLALSRVGNSVTVDRAPKNATLVLGGDPACTGPGGASKMPVCPGLGGALADGLSSSSRVSRVFSAFRRATCVRSAASSSASAAGARPSACPGMSLTRHPGTVTPAVNAATRRRSVAPWRSPVRATEEARRSPSRNRESAHDRGASPSSRAPARGPG
jgi:hypothetical protein